jgi:heme-degrading monooxygenase HmoA
MASIMRSWHGRTPTGVAGEYLALMTPRALADYRSVPGNLGAWVLSRRDGDITHVTTLSLWSSWDAIAAFAGTPPDAARYYDFDPRYLLELEPTVTHWEVHGG